MHIEVRYPGIPFKSPAIVEGHKTSTPSSLSDPLPAFVRNESTGAHQHWVSQLSFTPEKLTQLSRFIPWEQRLVLEEQSRFTQRHARTRRLMDAGHAAHPAQEATRGGLRLPSFTAYETAALSGLGTAVASASSAAAAIDDARYVKAAGLKASVLARTHMAEERRIHDEFVAAEGLDEVTEHYANSHRIFVDGLAMAKLYSIISYVLSREREDRPASAAERRQAVRQILDSGKKNAFTGTSLLSTELTRARKMLETFGQFGEPVFAGEKALVQRRFARLIGDNGAAQQLVTVPEYRERVTRKALERALRDGQNHALKEFLGPRDDTPADMRMRQIPVWEIEQYATTNPGLGEAIQAVYLEEAAQLLKQDGKYLRSGYARLLQDCAEAHANTVPPSGPPSSEQQPAVSAQAPTAAEAASTANLPAGSYTPSHLDRSQSAPA